MKGFRTARDHENVLLDRRPLPVLINQSHNSLISNSLIGGAVASSLKTFGEMPSPRMFGVIGVKGGLLSEVVA